MENHIEKGRNIYRYVETEILGIYNFIWKALVEMQIKNEYKLEEGGAFLFFQKMPKIG